eukprot:scaffold417591_cov20-Prasinocladus_malaysianus.AAC.1
MFPASSAYRDRVFHEKTSSLLSKRLTLRVVSHHEDGVEGRPAVPLCQAQPPRLRFQHPLDPPVHGMRSQARQLKGFRGRAILSFLKKMWPAYLRCNNK